MQKPKITVRSFQDESVHSKATMTLPDAHSATPLGSGLVTKVISTGGGMAVIYEIWNSDLEVKRAVKLLRPDHSQESEERFQTEMKICAKLHHPNIVEIYAVGSWNGLPYIEMEEIEGRTVEKLIAEAGSLPLEVCTSIGIMVGRALNHAHNQKYMLYGKEYQGVIHRDLKPSNIMVPRDGIVKLMDFGIATPTSASMHTMQGTVVGTLQYLSPEQLEGREIDVRVDIYALGTVMYEMLTGVRAFPEANLAKLVPDKLNNCFTPLQDYRIKIPRPLRDLVHRCMRHDKESRVANPLQFLRALGKIHKNFTTQSPEQVMRAYMNRPHGKRSTIAVRRRVRIRSLVAAVMWILTGCAFLGAVMLGLWYTAIMKQEQEEPTRVQVPAKQPDVITEAVADVADDDGVVDDESEEQEREPDMSDIPHQAARRTRAGAARTPAVAAQSLGEVSAVSPRPPAPTPSPPSALERLKQKYGTEDVLSIFVSEVDAGRYREALKLRRKIPAEESQSKKAVLYWLRALQGAGRHAEARDVLRGNDVGDGEFHLARAQEQLRARGYGEAQEALDKASSLPCEYMDQHVFRGKLLHAKALCATGVFYSSPTKESKKKAMGAWYDVKTHYRRHPEHEHFTEADQEIRRINKEQVSP